MVNSHPRLGKRRQERIRLSLSGFRGNLPLVKGFIPIIIGFTVCFFVLVFGGQGLKAQETNNDLPPLQVHPLPTTLAQWQNSPYLGDYFSQVKPTTAGYLVWSQFPILVYLDRPSPTEADSASLRRFQQWVKGVLQAIQEWGVYLPLKEVEKAELADIIIERSLPPLGTTVNRETGKIEIFRARSAQTRYEFYLKDNRLYHRMTVLISPGLSESSILSAIRHELGHALGIWGHSPLETDSLYFSQVRDTPPISLRDVNTLKKVYQQPTLLGWEFKS